MATIMGFVPFIAVVAVIFLVIKNLNLNNENKKNNFESVGSSTGDDPTYKTSPKKNIRILFIILGLIFGLVLIGEFFKSINSTPAQQQSSTGTRTMDGVEYTVIDPATFNFNADTGRLNIGQRYVINDRVLLISGAMLILHNISDLCTFKLDSPLRLNQGTNVLFIFR